MATSSAERDEGWTQRGAFLYSTRTTHATRYTGCTLYHNETRREYGTGTSLDFCSVCLLLLPLLLQLSWDHRRLLRSAGNTLPHVIPDALEEALELRCQVTRVALRWLRRHRPRRGNGVVGAVLLRGRGARTLSESIGLHWPCLWRMRDGLALVPSLLGQRLGKVHGRLVHRYDRGSLHEGVLEHAV